MSSTIACRKAAKDRTCTSCRAAIAKGEFYLMITIFPGHDVIPTDRPFQSPECGGCATDRGRGFLLAPPVLEGQVSIDEVLEGGEHGVHEEAVQVAG